MGLCHQCGSACNEGDKFCPGCGASCDTTKVDPLIGRTVGGSFTLQELIGVGGMGRVYRAEQSALHRTVAVKVIHPHLLGDDQTVARFYTEARASSRLNHPNSVSIIDFGRTEDNVLYLVMEHLTGKDLAIVMHEEGPLPPARICRILASVLAALGEAHALGIIHRDLKPENVIVRRLRSGSDLVKVVDFGLATIVGTGSSSITAPGVVCGTPDYMSPEQGKGDPVDGRGDIYSIGVVLFELLTEQLPFEADTPTKVVLRHIGDPVPDPRHFATDRAIPDELAEITMRALAKSPDKRFQTAAELETALLAVADRLEHRKAGLRCAACGEESPSTKRFCGSCGAKLVAGSSPGDERPTRSGMRSASARWVASPSSIGRPFVARKDELDRLLTMRTDAAKGAICVQLFGEAGVGKTRMLSELGEYSARLGDLVISIEPHPSRAPVAYASIRNALARMLDLEPSATAAARIEGLSALEQAGAREVFEPIGLAGYEERTRSTAVARAFVAGCRIAMKRLNAERIVVLADDLDSCDGLTRRVVSELTKAAQSDPMLVAIAGASARIDNARTLVLNGLDAESARDLARRGSSGDSSLPPPSFGDGKKVLPLYVEQVRALGFSDTDGNLRLADVVTQRVDRLRLPARRLLQAAAVLGDRCTTDALRALVDGSDLEGASELVREEFFVAMPDGFAISHPLVRDLVEASIPAEARKTLHSRALRYLNEVGEALEVRAEHAYHAGEIMSALMLLERMGDAARERGDGDTSVLAFRRALELVRREILSTGDTLLDVALVTFSRKLGEALERAGEYAGADGVLREAMDLVGPASPERARMLVVLGRVAAGRGRGAEASRYLKEAAEAAAQHRDASCEAIAHTERARLRNSEGDAIGAANEYRKAIEILAKTESPEGVRARIAIEYADALIDLGDSDEAGRVLQAVLDSPVAQRMLGVLAMATGTRGTVDELKGDRQGAEERYREAARLAALAGDTESFERWQRAVTALAA